MTVAPRCGACTWGEGAPPLGAGEWEEGAGRGDRRETAREAAAQQPLVPPRRPHAPHARRSWGGESTGTPGETAGERGCGAAGAGNRRPGPRNGIQEAESQHTHGPHATRCHSPRVPRAEETNEQNCAADMTKRNRKEGARRRWEEGVMKARRAATDTGTTPGELDAAHPAPRSTITAPPRARRSVRV